MRCAAGNDDHVAAGALDEGGNGLAGVALFDDALDVEVARELGHAFADGGFEVELVGALDVEADVAMEAGHGVEDDEFGAETGSQSFRFGEDARAAVAEIDRGGDFVEVDVFEAGLFHVGAGEHGAGGIMEHLGGDAAEKEAAEGAIAVSGKHDEVDAAGGGVLDDLLAGEAFEEDAFDGHGGEFGEAGGVEPLLSELAARVHEFLQDGAAGFEDGGLVVGRGNYVEEDGFKGGFPVKLLDVVRGGGIARGEIDRHQDAFHPQQDISNGQKCGWKGRENVHGILRLCFKQQGAEAP